MVKVGKLNKALEKTKKLNVLVGPRASKGSYGDLANIISEKWSKKGRQGGTSPYLEELQKKPKIPQGRKKIRALRGGGRAYGQNS
jgi:hypothetical protein